MKTPIAPGSCLHLLSVRDDYVGYVIGLPIAWSFQDMRSFSDPTQLSLAWPSMRKELLKTAKQAIKEAFDDAEEHFKKHAGDPK